MFGSDFDDTFTVDSTFSGTFTNLNEIEGGGGDDLITGNGLCWDYLNADAGVFVDLGAGTASGIEAGDAANVGTGAFDCVMSVVRSLVTRLLAVTVPASRTFTGQAGDDFIRRRCR